MDYFEELNKLFSKIEVSDTKGSSMSLDEAIFLIVKLIIGRHKEGKRVFFIGNGGSASIANHMVTDFLKNAGIPAMSFSDSSLITCLGNDYGYEYVFERPLNIFTEKKDILFAISSSGKSENILRGVNAAKKKGCKVITLSGFNSDNPLRTIGDINIYVPSSSYGYVESVHSVICHCITDKVIEENKWIS